MLRDKMIALMMRWYNLSYEEACARVKIEKGE